MKKLLFLIVIIALAGWVVWSHLEHKASLETRRKVEQEVMGKEKATKSNNVAAGKTEERLVLLQKQYRDTAAAWEPLQQQIKSCREAVKVGPEAQHVDTTIQQQAMELKRRIMALTVQIDQAEKKTAAEKKNLGQIETSMSWGGSKDEKYSGWYYSGHPESVYPMSALASRNRKHSIHYVHKKTGSKETRGVAAKEAAKRCRMEYDQFVGQRLTLIKQYNGLKRRLDQAMAIKIAGVRKQAEPILQRRQELRQEIVLVAKSVGNTAAVAAVAHDRESEQ
ncbi:MAG: hypothetical protein PHQ27_06530 [Victivallales bacterium]|nr:hypothetical protein [Victivallales bacterium]